MADYNYFLSPHQNNTNIGSVRLNGEILSEEIRLNNFDRIILGNKIVFM